MTGSESPFAEELGRPAYRLRWWLVPLWLIAALAATAWLVEHHDRIWSSFGYTPIPHVVHTNANQGVLPTPTQWMPSRQPWVTAVYGLIVCVSLTALIWPLQWRDWSLMAMVRRHVNVLGGSVAVTLGLVAAIALGLELCNLWPGFVAAQYEVSLTGLYQGDMRITLPQPARLFVFAPPIFVASWWFFHRRSRTWRMDGYATRRMIVRIAFTIGLVVGIAASIMRLIGYNADESTMQMSGGFTATNLPLSAFTPSTVAPIGPIPSIHVSKMIFTLQPQSATTAALLLSVTVLLWAFTARLILLFSLKRYLWFLDHPHCLRCGYDLRGSVSAECPECGHRTPIAAK